MNYSQAFKDQIEAYARNLERSGSACFQAMRMFSPLTRELLKKGNTRIKQAEHLRRTFINPPTQSFPLDL